VQVIGWYAMDMFIIRVSFALFFCLLFHLKNRKIQLPSFSEQEINFVNAHYHRRLHYDVYINRDFTIWIWFAAFVVVSFISLFEIKFLDVYMVFSFFYLIAELGGIIIAKKEAHTTRYLERINMLSNDDSRFQSSLFEKCKPYAFVDPNTFHLSSIYKISLRNYLFVAITFLVVPISYLYIFLKDVIT
jgi:hypothetical protein